MPTQYKIGKKGERLIIDNFIESNNRISWATNISKEFSLDNANVQKILKNLVKKGILTRINCPDDIIEKLKKEHERGGSYPADCYLLNYDMSPEWFVEIARPYLNKDDKKTRLEFMTSPITSAMVYHKNIINWIIQKTGFDLEVEREILPFIFNCFPSTLRWVLYGDLSIIQKSKWDKKTQKHLFISYLNNKIIEDLLNEAYLQHIDLEQMYYNFTTRFKFCELKPHKGKKGKRPPIQKGVTGVVIVKFKDIPEIERHMKKI